LPNVFDRVRDKQPYGCAAAEVVKDMAGSENSMKLADLDQGPGATEARLPA
jgi:hypothetical protein